MKSLKLNTALLFVILSFILLFATVFASADSPLIFALCVISVVAVATAFLLLVIGAHKSRKVERAFFLTASIVSLVLLLAFFVVEVVFAAAYAKDEMFGYIVYTYVVYILVDLAMFALALGNCIWSFLQQKRSATGTSNASDGYTTLKQYYGLLQGGIITQEEYDSVKEKLLNGRE